MSFELAPTRDGTRLAYTLHGDKSAENRAVLVHSVAMDREFWRPVAERLAPKAAVLTYDCRGHGASDKPGGPYTVELFADDLAELMDHVGWPTALVAGASMGGMVSLAFASIYPERTAALGLIDTTAWYGPDAAKSWAERADKAMRDGLGSLVEFQTTRWFGDAFRAEHPEVVNRCIEVFLRNDIRPMARPAGCSAVPTCAPRFPASQDADRGRGRRGGLRGAARDGGSAQSWHRRLDLQGAEQGASSHTARAAGRDRGRARGPDGADPAMKFTGELSVKAPRAAVYEKLRDARFFASCVDGVRDLAEIGA